MVDAELGLTDRLQRLHLQLPASCARSSQAEGHRFFSHGDTEVVLKAYAEWGERLRRPPRSACSPSRSSSATAAGSCWPATGSASSRSTWPRRPGALRFASTLPALLAGGGVDTDDRPGRAAPLPDLPLASCRRRARSCAASRKLPPATVRIDRARRHASATGPTGTPPLRPRPRRGATGPARTGRTRVLESLRLAVAPAHGRRRRRSACCSPAASTPAWSSALLAERGPDRTCAPSASASRRSAAARATSSATPTSSPSASAPTTTRSRVAAGDLVPPLDGAVAAMSEPMVSHDVVAFYLLAQEVSRARQGRAVRPGRRRGLRRLPLVPAAGRRRRERRRRRTPRRSSTATRPALARVLDPAWLADGDASRAFVAAHFARPGARHRGRRGAAPRHRGHARRRPGQAGRQHDDGVRARGPRAVPRPRARRAGRAAARRS